MNVDLIGPYSKYRRKQQLGGAIIKNNVNLTCMTMIGFATGWFKIVEIPMFNLYDVATGNDEYIDE